MLHWVCVAPDELIISPLEAGNKCTTTMFVSKKRAILFRDEPHQQGCQSSEAQGTWSILSPANPQPLPNPFQRLSCPPLKDSFVVGGNTNDQRGFSHAWEKNPVGRKF